MKRLAGLDLRIFLDLIGKSVDSTIRSHRFDEQEALILEFELKAHDFRLVLLSKLLNGKWRPPSTYRIESFTFLSRDFLKLLELTQLYPKFILNLVEMQPRFGNLVEPLRDQLKSLSQKILSLEQVRDLIFAEIQRQNLTLRFVAQQAKLTEMSLHNYRKKANLHYGNLLQLCQVLKIELFMQPFSAEYEPRLAR